MTAKRQSEEIYFSLRDKMSHDLNTDNQSSKFPNPYKVENLAIIIAGSLMILVGIGIMISVRNSILLGLDRRVETVLGISIGLIAFGIALIGRALGQLQYSFDADWPESLTVPTVPQNQDGDSPHAKYYKEMLFKNAIVRPNTQGALNGMLYAWLPHLKVAPSIVQRSAQTQFHNFLSLAATFVSFLVCWFMFGQGPTNSWVGLIYGWFVFFQIMRPMTAKTAPTTGAITEAANVGKSSLIVLILLAVFGPVIIGFFAPQLPSLEGLSINGVVLLTLLSAFLGCGVFGLALRGLLLPPPQTSGVAKASTTVTMKGRAIKLVEEMERRLEDLWQNSAPSRRYSRRSPIIAGKEGQFSAEIFEETQPRPLPDNIVTSVNDALSTPQFFWLTCLTGLAFAFLVAGTLASIIVTQDIVNDKQAWSTDAFATSVFALGIFCYRAAHVLWGRIHFVSELIWIEISGSYESAEIKFGNQRNSSFTFGKDLIVIDSMTMRVWASKIDTVIFGKSARRELVGMRGLQELADELAATLKSFGEDRPILVAPTSTADDKAVRAAVAIEQQMAAVLRQDPNQLPALSSPAVAPVISYRSSTLLLQVCQHCRASIDADASYCGECGEPVAKPRAATRLSCKRCGVDLENDASFCGECGSKVMT